jgi:AraC-like DNA-binding protein
MVDPHHHLYHELDFILSGRGVFAVGSRKVEVRAGDAVYLARGVHHWRQSDPSHPLELCNLVLDDPAMRRILDNAPPESLAEWPWWYRWTAHDLENPEQRLFLRRLVALMQRRDGLLTTAEIRSLLPGIGRLLALGRARMARAQPALHRLARRVRHAPQQRLNLNTEAARMGASRWWLSRVFKRHFGVSLWEHRNFARVDLAITKLLSSDVSVRELGRQMGFAGTAQFINTFKRLTGLTPEALRRRYTLTRIRRGRMRVQKRKEAQ